MFLRRWLNNRATCDSFQYTKCYEKPTFVCMDSRRLNLKPVCEEDELITKILTKLKMVYIALHDLAFWVNIVMKIKPKVLTSIRG